MLENRLEEPRCQKYVSDLPDVEVDLIAVDIAVREILRPSKFANMAFNLTIRISTLDSLVAGVDVSSASFKGKINFVMSSSVVSTVPFTLISVCTSTIVVLISVWMTEVKNDF